MIKFTDFIHNTNKSFTLSDLTEQSNQVSDLYLGKIQPLHKGHLQVFERMTNPIIVLSNEKISKSNPFSIDYRAKMLEKVVDGVRIIKVTEIFLPEILIEVRKLGFEPRKLYSSANLVESLNRMNKYLPKDNSFDIKIIESPRITSDIKIRKCLKENNFEAFKKLMPRELHDEFLKMKRV